MLVSLLCLAVSVSATPPSVCYSWDVFQDGRLDGRTLRSLKTGPFTCMRECLVRKSCQSINYCHPTQECHLNYEITSPNNSLRKENNIFPFKYLEKSNMSHLVSKKKFNLRIFGGSFFLFPKGLSELFLSQFAPLSVVGVIIVLKFIFLRINPT